MIPENKQTAVKVALQTAFGVTSYNDIKRITIGLSTALIYRIVVKNKPYLMRIAPTDSKFYKLFRKYASRSRSRASSSSLVFKYTR